MPAASDENITRWDVSFALACLICIVLVEIGWLVNLIWKVV